MLIKLKKKNYAKKKICFMFCVQIWLCKKRTPIQLNGRSLSPVKLISYIVALPDSFDKMMMMMSVLCNGKKSNST